jgi:uncharacterized protein YprB with RNaseH-like and TPR domain
MNIDSKDYLRLVEHSEEICFFDIEATGLKGDYNSILVVSIKPYGKKPISLKVEQVGNDQKVVRLAKDYLESFQCWVSYYGRGFDIPMVNTRLLKWGMQPIEKRFHIDMYFTLKHKLVTSHMSQGHLCSWLKTDEQKMSVSADAWSEMAAKTSIHMPTMVKRCESDVAGLENLYNRTKHLIVEIKK